ncbi:Vacuolar protein sorting-associated protein 35 [Plasmodiophora brassicae]
MSSGGAATLGRPGSRSSLAGGDEQDRILDEANNNVKRNAFYMKRAIDEGHTGDAIKFATDMIYELRTGKLSPQNYYDLYISVTDELRSLEAYLEDVHLAADKKSNLYEKVQHAGNIIPRLYLLVLVGCIYIRTQTSPAMDILFDLVELCKGVQHPTRGLFLRSYLTQCSKDKLPDVNTALQGVDLSDPKPVKDAIEFLLQNFSEVNRLWVRMQHQGANRDRARRERERQNLRMLVGTNLVRLSQLESIDLATYKEVVLPRLLEQVINCKDKIAQEYLMDCIIQVFPDEYHLATLETFLGSISQLQPKVNSKDIVISLMNRLSSYALQSPHAIPDDLEMFAMFRDYSKTIMQTKEGMPVPDVLSLQVALINFASKVYPDRLSYIDDILSNVAVTLQSTGSKTAPAKGVRHVVKLLTVPLETVSTRVLDLAHYANVLQYLDFENRKQVANSIVQSVLEAGAPLTDLGKATTLFEYIAPLLRDLDDTPPLDDSLKYEFEAEQHDVARLVHLLNASNTDAQFALLQMAKKQLCSGGPTRMPFTMPALAFSCLRLIPRVFEREQREDVDQAVKSKNVFRVVHQLISSIASTSPQVAVRIFLATALASDRCAFEEITYEFMTQAFMTYEEEIANSKEQHAAVQLFAGTIQHLSALSEESYDTLSSKVTQHAARLLKKRDQVRGLCLCAHMLWTSKCGGKNRGEAVLSALQRAIKISNNVMNAQEQAELLIEILDDMVHFFEKEVQCINAERIKNVVELVQEHLADLEDGRATKTIKGQFDQIVDRIKAKDGVSTYSHDAGDGFAA